MGRELWEGRFYCYLHKTLMFHVKLSDHFYANASFLQNFW